MSGYRAPPIRTPRPTSTYFRPPSTPRALSRCTGSSRTCRGCSVRSWGRTSPPSGTYLLRATQPLRPRTTADTRRCSGRSPPRTLQHPLAPPVPRRSRRLRRRADSRREGSRGTPGEATVARTVTNSGDWSWSSRRAHLSKVIRSGMRKPRPAHPCSRLRASFVLLSLHVGRKTDPRIRPSHEWAG